MAGDDGGAGPVEGVGVERAGEVEGDGEVVGGAGVERAPGEPDAVLGGVSGVVMAWPRGCPEW